MKGVILAGGLGTRLHPLTKVINKHLLPVYKKPMIFYPIETLIKAGIEDILIVTGGNHAGEFLRLIGNGKEFGLKHVHYTYQEGEGGIAEALGLARYFCGDDKMVVVLGDNIIEKNIVQAVRDFAKQEKGGKVLLKQVPDPQRFGVAMVNGDRVEKIIEKPKEPQSDLAVVGIYFYDPMVFEFIDQLEPSDRGELEITDVNNMYLERGLLTHALLDGWWTDAGTFDSLLRANRLVAETGANNL